jgi:exodeoxyribonuclease VII small subunit
LEGEEFTFEQAFQRLEETVRELEAGGLSLAEMLSVFEEGMRLVKLCNQHLDAGELKLSQLIGTADGSFELSPTRFEQQ